MKNQNRNESIVIIVFTFILIAIIGLVAYSAYSSTNNIESNKENSANVASQPNTTSKTDTNDNSSNNTTNSNVGTTDKSTHPNSIPMPVETQIAYFATNIYDKDQNRVDNIALAIKKINGTVIKSGETFSFNDTVGPMGEQQGFKEAIGFDTNGKKIKMFGGGMCQISSTIYNAALISGLEIVERHPHSRRVYYVPKDKDATVYYDTLDLKFKNTTDSDIKIIATSDNYNVTITLNKITVQT